jgi:integrase
MARTRKDARINTRSARISLQQRKEPYWRSISKGLAVGYYKGTSGGAWIAKRFSKATGRQKSSLGVADDFEDADGIRVLSFDQAQAKAREWATLKVQEDTGEVHAGSFTVAQAMEEYLTHLTKAKRKPQHRTAAISKAHILPRLGNLELAKLTHGKVKAWRDELAQTAPRLRTRIGKPQAYRTVDPNDPLQARKRQATANRILTVLKAALNHAKSDSRRVATNTAWVDVKPFSKVDVPKVRFLSNEEVSAVVKKCDPDFQALVKGALLTGCRYGELTALTVADFNSKDGQVYIAESKNGESRYVDLNDAGIDFFSQLTASREPEEKIFLRSNGKAWKTSEQFRPMNAACEAAEVEGVTFHILRHTYASHALMAGMTIEVLAQQLGHKDTRITMRHYAHLCPTFKQESVRRNAPSFGFDVPQKSKRGPRLVKRAKAS